MGAENFNFSKIGDQSRFESLPEKEKKEIVKESYVSGESMNSTYDEMQELIRDRQFELAHTIGIKRPGLSKRHTYDTINSLAINEIYYALSKGNIYNVKKIISTFNVPKNLIYSEETRQIATEAMKTALSNGYANTAVDIKSIFNLNLDVTAGPAMDEALTRGLLVMLSNADLDSVISTVNIFGVNPSVFQSPEIRLAAEEAVIEVLRDPEENFIDYVNQIGFLNLGDDFFMRHDVSVLIKEHAIISLENGKNPLGYDFYEKAIPEEFKLTPEAILAAKAGIIKSLEAVNEKVGEGYLIEEDSELDNIEFTLDDLKLSLHPNEFPEFHKALSALVLKVLSNKSSFAHNFLRLKNFFEEAKLSSSFVPSTEIFDVAKVRIAELLTIKSIKKIEDIINIFQLPESVITEALSTVTDLTKFPVGPDAIEEIIKNDRFGMNLVMKYNQFDSSAKDAIDIILHTDENIDERIDRRSLEYRLQVINALRPFKKNEEILNALAEEGIDTEEWLGYNRVEYFDLGESDNLTVGEMIHQPVSRLPESLQAYTKAMKEALTFYKNELLGMRIPEDMHDIKLQIESLQKAIHTQSDEDKLNKMELSLSILRARISEPKLISVWDKTHSEFSKLVKLSENIVATNTLLTTIEKEEITVVDDISLLQAKKRKAKLWEVRKKLTEGLTTLKVRIDGLFEMLQKTLTASIGKERAEAITRQIKCEVAEHHDHIQTDFNTIFSFISHENGSNELEEGIEEDEDDAEELGGNVQGANEIIVDGLEVPDDDIYKGSPIHAKRLEGRPMSIRVAGRSRQDLYTGNYTTCCVRIDSDFHQAESPIADYVTDLGMQNVLIYDETTKTPIACAWCWIGKNQISGETGLVVDNVEGWQLYTVNFRSQLESNLHAYLEKYAKSIGARYLSQGPTYNDLNVLPSDEQMRECEKLGGSNRAGGYYLEAEMESEEEVDNDGVDHDDDND